MRPSAVASPCPFSFRCVQSVVSSLRTVLGFGSRRGVCSTILHEDRLFTSLTSRYHHHSSCCTSFE
ncbi:unnamed protein product, partial [Nesidiocoris tenuis]